MIRRKLLVNQAGNRYELRLLPFLWFFILHNSWNDSGSKDKENQVDKLKKEWKSIVVGLWMVFITMFLFNLSGKVNRLHAKSNNSADVLGSVEGVVISVDAGVQDVLKRMNIVESQLDYIRKKTKRR